MLKQFKLTNDEEIVCEIVQWPEDVDEPVIIKKVLKINSSDNYLSGTKYYSLRPWMSFYDNIDLLYSLNPFHILGEIEPSDDLKELYLETLQMIAEDLMEGKHKMSKVDTKLKSEREAAQEILKNNSELFDSLTEQYDLDFRMDRDSAEERLSNIVSFKKPKGTVH